MKKKTKKMKIPTLKPRNPLVKPTITRSGAGKHKDKKRKDKHTHKE